LQKGYKRKGDFTMRAREGDLIRTENNVIFDVKGLVHPPDRVIAFPRYIPSATGNRGSGADLYGKVYNLAERFQYLQENTPNLIVHDAVFDADLCEVPHEAIKRRYDPIEKLALLRTYKKLEPLEKKAVMLAEDLKEAAGLSWSAIGISGSVLVGLYSAKSDLDPIVYGVEACRKAYAALEDLLEDGDSRFKRYNRDGLRALFDFRSKDTFMSFEDFARVERRKAFQGMFEGVDYFVRFVKDWSQIKEQYGDVCYRNSGYAKITATVADDTEALFTPCTYKLENVTVVEGAKLKPISETASFRGRFCEQARKGEAVTAQGKVERVTNMKTGEEHYRIILGNKPSDYMVLSHG
jgi:predicted nucleotidyltransferase